MRKLFLVGLFSFGLMVPMIPMGCSGSAEPEANEENDPLGGDEDEDPTMEDDDAGDDA